MAVTIEIQAHRIDGWRRMTWAERQVALQDEAAAGYVPREAFSLEADDDGPVMVPNGYAAPTTSTGWWGQSIFADLVGGTPAVDPNAVQGGGGFFGLPGFGLVGNGGDLTRNGWLFVALGLGVITLAVITRRS